MKIFTNSISVILMLFLILAIASASRQAAIGLINLTLAHAERVVSLVVVALGDHGSVVDGCHLREVKQVAELD